MKRLAALSFVICLVVRPILAQSPQPSARSTSSDREITVAFWNIQWFPGGRPAASHSEQARQIDSVHGDITQLNADIIGMEEVRDFDRAALAVQPLAGFKVDVCANFPPREGQNEAQEVAIASRLQPLSAWAEQWKPNGAMQPPRGFAFAVYQVAPNELLFVYDVHLKSNRGADIENVAMRQESTRQLRSHIAQMQSAYEKLGKIDIILGGDFNTSLDDKRFAAEKTVRDLMSGGFAWALQSLSPSARTTVPAGNGFADASFDHIFYRGLKLKRASVANTSPRASDHRPVVATFDVVDR